MMKVYSGIIINVFFTLTIYFSQVQCEFVIDSDVQANSKTRNLVFAKQSFFASNVTETLCALNVQKDLPKPNEPQPLYLVPETDRIWTPNKNGYLMIPKDTAIELFCSKSFANITEGSEKYLPKNIQILRPTCVQGKIFTLNGQTYNFRDFVCTKPVRFTVEKVGVKCADSAEMYRVGFNITTNRFIETMRICHDDDLLKSHYTEHRLQPGNINFQRYVNRLNFSKAGFFNKLNVNFFYTQRNQKQQAANIFGLNNKTVLSYFNKTDAYLSRGHLAAKSDFIYANQQRSTFTFFNVAPQWQSFNGGQWAALEDEVRKYVAKFGLDVDCYTGTWGTMHLAPPNNSKLVEQPFYLAYDANNNGILPVPQLYYRIIIDRHNSSRGIAIVGVNNLEATLKQIQDSYIICDNIAEEISWLRWIRNRNLRKGFLYACNVSEFAQTIGELPVRLYNVTEILDL